MRSAKAIDRSGIPRADHDQFAAAASTGAGSSRSCGELGLRGMRCGGLGEHVFEDAAELLAQVAFTVVLADGCLGSGTHGREFAGRVSR